MTDTEDDPSELCSHVYAHDIFDLEQKEYISVIYKAYRREIEYLKTAWVAPVKSGPQYRTLPPSDFLFGKRYGEVDRTLTGIYALRWIHHNDYESYTQNQPLETKLSLATFQEMRQLFQKYDRPEDILTLIMMQMTNDLGKSKNLQNLYDQEHPGRMESQVNHDMMMYYVVRDHPELVPSFQRLPVGEQSLVSRLLCVSAEFNPAQLVQSECPPEAMLILQEQDWSFDLAEEELDRKFLELLLDLSGALGQIDHEGAKTMTEPVVRSLLHALKMSKAVARNRLTVAEAYYQVLEQRLDLLKEAGWDGNLDIRHSDRDFAKTRLFCMGRVDTKTKAEFFDQVYENLATQVQRDLEWGLRIDHNIARQATYMPGMIANCNTTEQLTALFHYLSRVLFIKQSDLDELGHYDDIVILERDVMWTIGDIVKQQAFKEQPSQYINEETALPKLQVLKRSHNRQSELVGDEWYRQHYEQPMLAPN